MDKGIKEIKQEKKTKLNLNNIKYVYFDMDGTLLTSQKNISEETLEILKKLKERKISCSIATGRPYYFAQREIKTVNPHLPVISCNGALVYNPKEDQIISFDAIKKESTKKIFDILIRNDAIFLVYTKEQIFLYKNDLINPKSKWFDWIFDNIKKFDDPTKIKVTFIKDIEDFDITNYDIIKFLIIYSEISIDKYSQIEKDVKKINDVYIVKSQNEVFDIMPKGFTKGHGLKVLHDKGLINLEETLVFGDAENDLSMFAAAKWSVAMGNAQEATKKAATFITDSHDNNGIANFFNKLFNDEKEL